MSRRNISPAKALKLKKIAKKKAKIRRIRFGLLTLVVCLVGYIGYGFWTENTGDGIEFETESAAKPSEVEEQEKTKEAELDVTVLNSQDPVIQDLVALTTRYPKVKNILKDTSLYPHELLDLASRKPETIDFVLNYPKRTEVTNISDISVSKDYKEGRIPLFIQWDERWGYEKYGSEYVAIAGCGPTALSMVIVGLTGDTTANPLAVSEFSNNNGYYVEGQGSSWDLMSYGATHFGVKGSEIPLSPEVIRGTLESGQPIVASMGPGTFTTVGHFIVMTGITEDGKIIVNDPDSKEKSEKTWDVSVFMEEANNLWSFSRI